MKFNGRIINLFGEELFLHERTIKDAFDHNEFAEDQTEWTANSEIYFQVVILQSALKFNITKISEELKQKINERENTLFFRLLKKNKLTVEIESLKVQEAKFKKKLKLDYIYQNLGIAKLRELVDVVRFDIEKQSRSNEKTEKIGRANMVQLVAHYSNMKWEDVENLSVSEFVLRLEQSINLLNSQAGGPWASTSKTDEQREWEKVYEHFYGNVN